MSHHYLVFSAPVDARTCGIFIPYLIELQVTGATHLTIAINSPGGNVASGVAMYNAMLAMPYQIATHNFGNADSIAIALFCGGEVRSANPAATFMFHGVGFNPDPTVRLERQNLLERLDMIRADHKRIAHIIASRTGLTTQGCLGLFKKQSTRDAEWAERNGLIHSQKDLVIPHGVNLKHLV